MPIKVQACRKLGCPEVGHYKNGYCEKHQTLAIGWHRKKFNASKFYSSGRWQKLRAWIIKRQPICMVCGMNVSEEVDHIIPLSQGGAEMDADNLQGICKACHSSKTVRDSKGS